MVMIKYSDGESRKFDYEGKILGLIRKTGENPEEIVTMKDGKLVAEDFEVRKGDVITFVRVVSKG